MKRILCLILALASLALLCGCSSKKSNIQQPVNFYYRASEINYGSSDGLIRPEIAESSGYTEVQPLLNTYLKGPTTAEFTNPFLSGTYLLDAYVIGKTVYLELNATIADLSGFDLTIACACLTMTTLELVDATYVCISADGALMEGALSITMSLDDLILEDLYTPETTEQ